MKFTALVTQIGGGKRLHITHHYHYKMNRTYCRVVFVNVATPDLHEPRTAHIQRALTAWGNGQTRNSVFLSSSPRTHLGLSFDQCSVTTNVAVEQLGHTTGSGAGKQETGCKDLSHLQIRRQISPCCSTRSLYTLHTSLTGMKKSINSLLFFHRGQPAIPITMLHPLVKLLSLLACCLCSFSVWSRAVSYSKLHWNTVQGKNCMTFFYPNIHQSSMTLTLSPNDLTCIQAVLSLNSLHFKLFFRTCAINNYGKTE